MSHAPGRFTLRDSAGRYADRGTRGHLTGKMKGVPVTDRVIATEDRIVHDDQLQIDRQIKAGQPIPPELVDAYEKVGKTEKSAGSRRQTKSDSDD